MFRLGDEWLAIAAAAVAEVLPVPPIHSLPRRTRDVISGIVNVRGELLPCAWLARLFSRADTSGAAPARQCLLVLALGDLHVACPVDDVFGMIRFHPRQIRPLPSTLEKAAARFSAGLLAWEDRTVGVLDADVLAQTLQSGLK